MRYNLASAADSDWKVGDTVTFASCTTGANNGSFLIVRVSDDGGNNVVITNASGVAQTGAAGTCTLRAYSYNFTNPVGVQFVATETVLMSGHTSGASDGGKAIYAVNSGGNNIIAKDSAGVIQGGVAGAADVLRWVFAFTSAASATDFLVDEFAQMSGHTSGANNGNFRVTAVNSGGNNLVVYNASGVVQGGVAGTVNTNRWVYALSSDPTAFFSVVQQCVVSGATNAANDGVFFVQQINRGGSNNLVLFNASGVAQAGAAGTLVHSRMVVTLASDLSTVYTTASNVEILGSPSTANNGFFDVVAVNQGGGANYNVVVVNTSAVLQASPAGRIITESKSIFSTRPKITFPTTGESTYNNTTLATQTTAPVFDGTGAIITSAEVTAGVSLGMDIVSLPTSGITDKVPLTLVVQVA